MRKIIFIFIIFTLCSCSERVKQSPFFDSAPLPTPYQAESDTSILVIRDYYPLIKDIKYIKSAGNMVIPLSLNGNYDTVAIVSSSASPMLSFLEIGIGSGEKGVIVYERNLDKMFLEDLPFISSVGINFPGNKVFFKTQNTPANYLILWQNTVLDSRFVEYSDKGTFSVSVPENAEALERSYLRVFVSNENGVGNDLLIPVEYGRVITDPSALKKTDVDSPNSLLASLTDGTLSKKEMISILGDDYILYLSNDLLSDISIYMGDYVIVTKNNSSEKKKLSLNLPLGLKYKGKNTISLEINPHSELVIDNIK